MRKTTINNTAENAKLVVVQYFIGNYPARQYEYYYVGGGIVLLTLQYDRLVRRSCVLILLISSSINHHHPIEDKNEATTTMKTMAHIPAQLCFGIDAVRSWLSTKSFVAVKQRTNWRLKDHT